MRKRIALTLIALFVVLPTSVALADTLPIVAGKNVGPVALGMISEKAYHRINKGFRGDSEGQSGYVEDSWHPVVLWPGNRASYGTLHVISKDNRVVQIEITTVDATLAAPAYARQYDDEYQDPAYKKALTRSQIVGVTWMKTSFKAIRQRHPGMQVKEFSVDNDSGSGPYFYYIDDIAHGIAFTFLAADPNAIVGNTVKSLVCNLTPNDVPERVIVHRPGVSVLALHFNDDPFKDPSKNPPLSVPPSPYLSRIRAWFAAKPRTHKGN